MAVASNSAEAIYQLLSTDSTLQILLGGTTGDKRVYREYPQHNPKAEGNTPGFLIITRVSATPIGNSQFGDDEYWQARVIATTPDKRDSIADRIKRLINSEWQAGSITISGNTVVDAGSANSGIEGYSDDPQGYTVNVRFTVKVISNTE